MPAPTAQLKLPAARAAQLKALAAAHSLGIAETIEFLIGRAVEAGDIADVLPGYEVLREGDRVILHLEGRRLPGLIPVMALDIANNLSTAATQLQAGKALMDLVMLERDGRSANYQVAVGRHGHGVVIGLTPFANGKRMDEDRITASMTTTMALDLARQIRAVAQSH